MSTSFPTIQNFYSPVASPSKQHAPSKAPSLTRAPNSGDGFTSSERVQDIASGPSSQWSPEHDYEEASIGDLCPGPRWVTFTCRVVNIYDRAIESKAPQSAKGCLKLLVKDECATLLIKLWYATTLYDIRLGTLLTCWTTHIHSTSSLAGVNETLIPPSSPIVTSIFPERDSGCHIQIHIEEVRLSACCRTPLGYFSGDPLPGLMGLDQYVNRGGNDIPNARLLVCVVAIGEPTTVTTKSGTQFLTLPIAIADRSLSTTLSLSQALIPSATTWTARHTILLLSSPKLLHNRVTTTPRSHIDIDPSIREAVSLRKHVQRENSPINAPSPSDLFDIASIKCSPLRLQFTFSSLSAFIAAEPDAQHSGYISVILTQVKLMELVRRRQLFSMESACCGMPVYGNQVLGRCARCAGGVRLRVNPDVVGGMGDESGGVSFSFSISQGSGHLRGGGGGGGGKRACSKILWTDEAWTQLLGREMDELVAFCREDVREEVKRENAAVLRYLEQRLLWMRVVLLVGWTGDALGGRLAVLRVVA